MHMDTLAIARRMGATSRQCEHTEDPNAALRAAFSEFRAGFRQDLLGLERRLTIKLGAMGITAVVVTAVLAELL